MATTARVSECSAEEILFVAIDVGGAKWKVGSTIGLGQKPRIKSISAGDREGFLTEIWRAKARFGLAPTARVICCYEAGRDGFWIHRWLESEGIESPVVDPASISVERRKRRRKTDRLDVAKLVINLMHWFGGEEKVWSVVRIPTVREEDARHFHRELESLRRERTRSDNRIRSLLATHGLKIKRIGDGFLEELEGLRMWDGSRIPPQLRSRLEREYERRTLVDHQMKEMQSQQREAVRTVKSKEMDDIRKVARLRGIGVASAWVLEMEFYAWRQFRNGRQVGSLAGFAPTPHESGEMSREQGISKAGNRRVRALAVELAWGWLRFQPQSKLSMWFQQRWGHGSKRARRVGIVALARKLLIALWRYLEEGIVPAGAVLKKR